MPSSEIKKLAKIVHDEMYSIENTLKRRGYIYAGEGQLDNILLPKNASNVDKYFFYMGSCTFRKLLKKMVGKNTGISYDEFEKDCGTAKRTEYLDFLVQSGILSKDNSGFYNLAVNVNDYGHTLEWYVSELFKRELGCTSAWGVAVEAVGAGGDFDVLARIESQLAYVETKCSTPNKISTSDVCHFLQRDQDLDPDISIFLIDTEDDISELIARFEDVMTPTIARDSNIKDSNFHYRIEQLSDFGNINHFLRRVFLINSKPSILTNIRYCLNYYFAIVTHSIYASRSRRMDFVPKT